MKKMGLDLKHESLGNLLETACIGSSPEVVKRLLDLGFPVNDQSTGGSSYVERILSDMRLWSVWGIEEVDMKRPRAKLAMLEVLVQHGGRWVPEDGREMNWIRRGLLSAPAEQTLTVIRIMAEHGACERKVIEALLKTPPMQAHIAKHITTIKTLLARLALKVGSALERDGAHGYHAAL